MVNYAVSLFSIQNVRLVRSEIVFTTVEVEVAVQIELLSRDILLVAVAVTLVFGISGSVRRQ